jgi:hypothetical protein
VQKRTMQARAPSFVDLLFRPAAGKVKSPRGQASTAANRGRSPNERAIDVAPEADVRASIMFVSGSLFSE